MAVIIKNRNVVADPWLRLELNADGGMPSAPGTGDIIVPLAMWREQRALLLARPSRLGVWLNSDEDPAVIAEDRRIKQIALATKGKKKSQGRRPWDHDWHGFWIEVCAYVHENGMPSTNEELAGRMQQWFLNQDGDGDGESPAMSEIRKHIASLRKRLSNSGN